MARGAQWLHNRAKAVEQMSKTIAEKVREELDRAGEPRDASGDLTLLADQARAGTFRTALSILQPKLSPDPLTS